MDIVTDFDKEAAQVLKTYKSRFSSVQQMVKEWRVFVDRIVLYGYSDYLPEWDFDISLRDEIEKIFKTPALQRFNVLHELKATVDV